jgi:hypothetical protein
LLTTGDAIRTMDTGVITYWRWWMGGAYVGRLLRYVLNNGFKLDQAFGDQVYHQKPTPTPPLLVTSPPTTLLATSSFLRTYTAKVTLTPPPC